ncbi:hypothetical protein BJX63DRAFT_380369, partial [Aspergillus granulosus]
MSIASRSTSAAVSAALLSINFSALRIISSALLLSSSETSRLSGAGTASSSSLCSTLRSHCSEIINDARTCTL